MNYDGSVRSALAVLVAAGCYAPSPPSGVACTTACPGDERCIDGFCRAGPLDATAVDVRLDTGPACATARDHDEDGDGIDDGCDPCPHIAGTAADLDGDGVGDACDPEPTMPRQRIAVFDPFTSRAAAWMNDTNATFGTDALVLASNGRIRFYRASAEFRVQIGGELVVDAAATNNQLVLELSHESTSSYYYGEFFNNVMGGELKITRRDGTMYATQDSTGYAGRIPAGAFAWTLDASVAAQRMTFHAQHGATDFPVLEAAITLPPLVTTPYILIGAGGVTARLTYFVIIETE